MIFPRDEQSLTSGSISTSKKGVRHAQRNADGVMVNIESIT